MFIQKSLELFVKSLGSRDSVPGGGGASAMVGAIGTALGRMVGSLTIGKKKYADVEEEIKELMERAERLQRSLLEDVDKDADFFEPLSKAYSLPSGTAEEKEEKEKVMEDALKLACTVPLEIMEKACAAIELHGEFAEKGSALAISDAGVGVILCKSALQGASLNVLINTKAMKDRDYAQMLIRQCDGMLEKYIVLADEIFEKVEKKLR